MFGDLVEFFGALVEAYGSAPLSEIAEDPDGRLLFGWLLALLVGSDAVNRDSIEDVSFWAHRALTASRQVKAFLARESRVLRGTRARVKADIARSDWDDEEIEVEKQSWQDL